MRRLRALPNSKSEKNQEEQDAEEETEEDQAETDAGQGQSTAGTPGGGGSDGNAPAAAATPPRKRKSVGVGGGGGGGLKPILLLANKHDRPPEDEEGYNAMDAHAGLKRSTLQDGNDEQSNAKRRETEKNSTDRRDFGAGQTRRGRDANGTPFFMCGCC